MELSRWQIWRMRVYLTAARLWRGMTLGARIMLVDGDRVLLLRHTYTPGWQLPGGGVEAGETAEDAAIREAFEETGYRVLGRPQLFGFYHNASRATRRDHVALYVARAHEPAHAFAPTREIAEIGWFAPGEVPADTTPGTRRRIAEVFGNRPPDARW